MESSISEEPFGPYILRRVLSKNHVKANTVATAVFTPRRADEDGISLTLTDESFRASRCIDKYAVIQCKRLDAEIRVHNGNLRRTGVAVISCLLLANDDRFDICHSPDNGDACYGHLHYSMPSLSSFDQSTGFRYHEIKDKENPTPDETKFRAAVHEIASHLAKLAQAEAFSRGAVTQSDRVSARKVNQSSIINQA